MGLSERFKEKLDTNDIFSKKTTNTESILENQNIKFISKPMDIETKKIQPDTKSISEKIISDSNERLNNESTQSFSALSEDFETRLISKIRKIPYWEEYSIQRQENMIKSYIDKKLKTLDKLNYTQEEKAELIQNILALANNR